MFRDKGYATRLDWPLCVSFPARLFFDVLELVLVQCLQDGDAATMGYKMKRFARLFNDPIFLGMVMSCHVCCNSDLYITFANLKFRP